MSWLQTRCTDAKTQVGAPGAGPKAAERSAPPNHRCLPRNGHCAMFRKKEAGLRPLSSPPLVAQAASEMQRREGYIEGSASRGFEGRRIERAAESTLLAAEWPLRGVPHKKPVCGLSSPPPVAKAADEMQRRGGYIKESA